MALMQNPASANGGAREDNQASKQVEREHLTKIASPSQLIATAPKNSRSRFEVRLETFNGVQRITLGIRDQNGLGQFKSTGPTFVFSLAKLSDIQQLLDRARIACSEAGLLP